MNISTLDNTLSSTLLNDETLTLEELLTLTFPNYLTIRQNGRVIKIWSILVTPELAQRILMKNTNNRTVSKANIDYLVNQIKTGEWKEISDPIQISYEDIVINGQHRLMSIIKSGVAVPLRIETNVDASTFTILDTGRKRNAADALSINNIPNTTVTSTTVRSIKIIEQKTINVKITPQQMVDYVNANLSIVESVKFGVSYYKKGNKVISASLLSVFHFLLKDNYKDLSEDFLIKIAIGHEIKQGCPTGALRNRFIELKQKNVRNEELLNYIIIAWNKFVNKEECKNIRLPQAIPTLIM
jgi:hypothetical protein